jgi:hypothetical protein
MRVTLGFAALLVVAGFAWGLMPLVAAGLVLAGAAGVGARVFRERE